MPTLNWLCGIITSLNISAKNIEIHETLQNFIKNKKILQFQRYPSSQGAPSGLNTLNFDFKDKFIFVPRIEGVSGTKIREAVLKRNLS